MRSRIATIACVLSVCLCVQLFKAEKSYCQQTVRGTVRTEISRLGLHQVGRLDSSMQLKIAIGLPIRNKAGLISLIQGIYDPLNANYRHYLTLQQFVDSFAPSTKDYEAMIAFVKTAGLEVNEVSANRLVVSASGRVADLERAFHVSFLLFNHPTEARTFFSADRDPVLTVDVPILKISGLDNFASIRSNLRPASFAAESATSGGTGSGPGGCFRGYDFRKAYAAGVSLTGSGQTIGLLAYGSYDPSDISYYNTSSGLPQANLENVVVNGNPAITVTEEEVCADIEMAHAMAPGSNIIVYEVEYQSQTYEQDFERLLNRMVSENRASVLSSSFSVRNAQWPALADQAFLEMAAQGQSFFQASGDGDALNYLDFNGNLVTFFTYFPCGDPYVTVVGGTNLSTSGPPNEVWSSESVWNASSGDPGAGSSGGYNSTYSIPTWQQGISSLVQNGGSTQWRNAPDVAMVATNIYVRYHGRDDSAASGTSLSAPLWAGLAAVVNQNLAGSGLGPAGFINPLVYAIGKGSRYSSDFHDIVSGNNIWARSQSRHSAGTGLDLCTGWGSPIGQALMSDFGPNLNVTISADLTVPANVTLTIKPGMLLSFLNGASLIVNGTLHAVATASQPITFNFQSPNPTTHNGIRFNAGSSGAISYCKVLHADRGISESSVSVNITNSAIDSCTNGIYLYGSGTNTVVDSCNIHDNSYAGIYLVSSSPNLISGNLVKNNGYGIYAITNSSPTVGNAGTHIGNNITNNTYGVFCWNNSYPMLGQGTTNAGYNDLTNTSWNVYNMSGNAMYANSNWWGTTNPSLFKTGGTGTVLTSNYLTSAVSIPTPPLSKGVDAPSIASGGDIPLRSTLDSVYQLVASSRIIDARNLCLSLINNFPDYAVSYNALNLLAQTYEGSDLGRAIDVLKMIFNKMPQKALYATAGLLLASLDKTNALSWLDQILERYENQSVAELALFDKFVTYYFEKGDLVSARSISDLLDSLFNQSHGANEAHRILGDPGYDKVDLNPMSPLQKTSTQVATMFSLDECYPNPFNPTTTIQYALPSTVTVNLTVYDVLGRVMATLAKGVFEAGYHNASWHAGKCASGVYFVRLEVFDLNGMQLYVKTNKLLLTK